MVCHRSPPPLVHCLAAAEWRVRVEVVQRRSMGIGHVFLWVAVLTSRIFINLITIRRPFTKLSHSFIKNDVTNLCVMAILMAIHVYLKTNYSICSCKLLLLCFLYFLKAPLSNTVVTNIFFNFSRTFFFFKLLFLLKVSLHTSICTISQ